jgi:hypothetical protein
MKRKFARTTLLISITALCLGVIPVQAAEHCSNAKQRESGDSLSREPLFFQPGRFLAPQ